MPTKKFKASILVVTMMIMGIILVSALSISLVSIQERKASMGASKSNQAYQIADTGIELVMADIVKGNNDRTNELSGCQSDGLIHGTGYTVELKDADEKKIACNTNTDLSEVIHIKSVGTASGQAQRSIEAAVAASGDDYDTSCFGSATSSDYLCCRMKKNDGSASCELSQDGNSWSSFSNNPFSSSLPGSYSLSCFSAPNDAQTSSSYNCCRTNQASGDVSCKTTNSRTGSWSSYANDPF